MAALFGRLAGLSLSSSLPIAWPNVSFPGKNPDGSPKPKPPEYLRAVFVPNATNRQHINSDGLHQYLGLLQVSVHWPVGQGESAPRSIAGTVASHFPTDLRLTHGDVSVRITKRPHVADLITEDDGVQVPVLVEWECYA